MVLLAGRPAAPQPRPQETHAAELYRAQTIVTGQGGENRIIGFASCLEDVLIKVSGQLRLAGDPRLDAYKSRAASLVRDFSYRDEKGGKPKNDEQGTRDRSFFLTADFDAAAINDILTALGVKPWLSRRPVLGVFVEMQQGSKKYAVADDSKQTELQRSALLAAAAKRGMSIALTDAATRGAEAVLTGRLVWDDGDLRWNSEWQLEWRGRSHQWQFAAITFDEAFRQGIGGAAQIIAGQQ